MKRPEDGLQNLNEALCKERHCTRSPLGEVCNRGVWTSFDMLSRELERWE